MKWFNYLAIFTAAICITVFLYRLFYLLSLGLPKDLSKETGSVNRGIIYSFTGAMSPMEKESAYLHLPTYAAGMLYHLGIFSSLLFFVWVIVTKFVNVTLPSFVTTAIAIFLVITSLAGFSILIKRVVSKELRYLSFADDYISNFLTTISLAATALYIFVPGSEAIYFVTMALLFTWMPLGKTRHLLYFFFARVHLGFFYGRRGAWPTVKKS
ncbi:MAG: hypothetical protein A2X17_06870 [Bacteroidetes bacterium GWF2_41_61]|nr:MAG: hypothetical protein A2X20_06810 [Bacteroidetes bacterium GWE2_40_15]OFY29675.1 MAG: hypothetical protein A2X17_06870 [Bacteroidetes bacterium GWF2_41_61]OFY89577.1 MAG: hypothetical protein A2266_04430 [Bacteroidetes bacterium RIFOXYA12_FULL_40_10]HBG24966.1 hypothetical protein [Rikenellaceae bacterium]HBZ26711.1 hypothetical protein [Rikenellaceae bacterium]